MRSLTCYRDQNVLNKVVQACSIFLFTASFTFRQKCVYC